MNITTAPLFIFEMANNHMGDVEHGLRIIRELHEATKSYAVRKAIKFQYRFLDTFIHPAYLERNDIKYVKRFRETRLSTEDFLRMKREAEALGFESICTGFDEMSVEAIEKQGFKFLKIASCSFTDWLLLERIVQTKLPVIASVGGVPLQDIDRVVSFFEHRKHQLSLMHCVAEYPTPVDRLNLNQIDLLRFRYPNIQVGYSTHESPDLLDAVKLAVAKGAMVFERHVGVPTEKYALNAYSSTPKQVAAWVAAAVEALGMCGVVGARAPFSESELRELKALRRGLFVRAAVKAGEVLTPEKLFFAIPTGIEQYTANDYSKYSEYRAKEDIPALGAVNKANVSVLDRREAVYAIVEKVKKFVVSSGVPLPSRADVEISHHYGVERFFETGAVLLSFVNRSYCKKAIVMLPGQSHPTHHHNTKEETFFVLHGKMSLSLDDKVMELAAGDSVLVAPGVKHSFRTESGVIFEEISSTHIAQDSFYDDPSITANKNRKTQVTYWIE
jgi:sialic acid synthase SpsE/quercetin dioxygenase-like cupin family protein